MTTMLFMQMLATVLLLLAAITAIPQNPYVQLGWAGLFFWALSTLVGR